MRERDLEREGKEKSTHPETLKKCPGAGGGQARWKGRFSLLGGRGKEEGRPGPVSSDTPPHPLDTPPTDPGPEERVQPQQTTETHCLRAGGGAAPRRAWYGSRAGSGASDSLGERVGGVGKPGDCGSCPRLGGGGDKVLRSACGSLGEEGTLLWDLAVVTVLALFRSPFPLQQQSLTVFLVLVKIVSLDL